MKKIDFLTKMKKQGSLELVEASNNISESYSDKSDKCMQVAKLAFDANIFENSITEAYYAIYNSVLSLFFACGIKCENHSVSVILINKLFNLHKLHNIFAEYKKDRIDNQYYVPISKFEPINKKLCGEKLNIAQDFILDLKEYKYKLTNETIKTIRENFKILK